MTMLAIALVMLCLSSVSAMEDSDISNSTLEIVNDNSQDENIVIDEIDKQITDDDSTKGSSVSVANETDNEILKATEDDVLGATSITDGNGKTGTITGYEVNDVVTIKVDVGMYDTYDLYVDGSKYDSHTVGFFESTSWEHTYQFTEAKTYSIQVKSGAGDSNILSFVVTGGTSATKETSVSITVPSTGTTNEPVSIPYQVTEKGTSTGVSSGTLTFYNGDAQIGSPITLTGSSGTFTHTFTSAATYNIKAAYTASSGYENSESSVSSIVISDSGNGGGNNPQSSNVNLTISEGTSSGGWYAFSDDYALIKIYNSNYPTTVNFKIDRTLSSPQLKWGTDPNSLTNSKSFTGTNPSVTIVGGSYSADINQADGNTYYFKVVDGTDESNVVAVKAMVGTNTVNSLDLSPNHVSEGRYMSTRLIDVSYYDYQRTFIGNATFYSSSSYSESTRLGTVSTEGGYLLGPAVSNEGGCCVWKTIYWVFSGIRTDDGQNNGAFGTGSMSIIVAYANTISLTSNGQTGTIDAGSSSIPLEISATYYMNDGTNSYYEIYIDDGANPVGTFDVASASSVNNYNLDVSGLSAGDHDVYVKYLGYWDATNEDYYADGESNHLTVHVEDATPSAGTISVSVTNTTYGDTVATISSGQAGTYTLKINNVDYKTDITFAQAGSVEVPITGYAASSTEYTALIVDNDNAGFSNSTTFTISQADANLQVTLTGNNTLLVDTQTLTVIANGNGKVRINNGAEQDLGEITLDNLVAGMNAVTVDYAGDENYTSASQTVYVNVYDKYSSSVSIAVNASGIAKGDSVKVTPTVTVNNNQVTKGSVALYYSNDTLIDTIDLEQVSYFVFTPLAEEGDTVTVYAKYLENSALSYAESPNSESKSIKIKRHLTIDLTVDGKTSFIGQVATQQFDYNTYQYDYFPKYVFYANAGGLNLQVKVYDNNELVSGTFTTDSEDISLYFTSSETGNHVVYVEFEGDDNYLSAKSNDVTFRILQSRTPSGLELTPNSAIEGTTVTITPRIYYQDYYSSKEYLTNGTLTLYSDYYKTNVVATIDLGEGGSFEYAVPQATSSPSSYTNFYWDFEGVNGDYYYSGGSSSSVSFYSMKENEIELTGNGETGAINVIYGNTVTLEVTLTQFYNRASDSIVLIYVDDINVANFTNTYDSGQGKYTINPYTFDTAEFGIGPHEVYAVYEGYADRYYYYAPGQSNNLTVNIAAPPKDTTLTLENTTPVVVDLGTAVTIRPTVLAEGETVLIGNISYYDNGVYITNLTAGNALELSSLDIGEHVISAKYLGTGAYNPSNSTNNITVVVNQPIVHTLKIDIATKQYPNELIAVITTSRVGNYTITVGPKTVNAEVLENDNGIKEVSLGSFTVKDNYQASIFCVEDAGLTNATEFNVTKGTLTFDVTSHGNNTVYGEGAKSIDASTDAFNATGKFTYSGDVTGEGASLDLSALAGGNYTIVISYVGDDNYDAEAQSVQFVVLSEYETQTSISISPDTITKGESITITPTVTANGQDVEEGQVEIWDNETLIATIDLANDKNYTYIPNKGKGTYSKAIFARFVKNETLKLGTSDSEAESYTINLPKSDTTVTLNVNATDFVSGEIVRVTPKVVDENGNNVTIGRVSIYDTSDTYYASPLATIDVGESYDYLNTNDYPGKAIKLYAKYLGGESEEVIYNPSDLSNVEIYYVYRNSLTLTTDADDTVATGTTVNFKAILENGEGTLVLIDPNGNEITVESNIDYPVEFTTIGDYTYYAKFTRDANSYYASAESEPVTIHVIAPKSTQLTLTNATATVIVYGETVTVMANVTCEGGEVTAGNVSYYIDGNYIANYSVGTPFVTNVDLSVDSHIISAKYMGYGIYDSCDSSNNITVDVNAKSIMITISTENTTVYAGETIRFTSVVKSGSDDVLVGNVTYKVQNGEDLAVEINVGEPAEFVISTPGEYDIIATYNGNEIYNASTTVTPTRVVVKGILTINLTFEDGSSEYNTTISSNEWIKFVADTDGFNPELIILVDGVEKGTIASGKTSESIRFTYSDKGNHTVQLKYAATTLYDETFSNEIALNIFERVSVTPGITVAPENVMNGTVVNITVGASNNAPGYVEVYSDYDLENLIATVAIGDSFEYLASVDSFTASSQTVTLYAKYVNVKADYIDYRHSNKASASFNVIRENSMNLTADNYEVRAGDEVTLTVDINDWKANGSNSNIIINVDGEDKYEFATSGYYSPYDLVNTFALTFDNTGEHVVYAYYKGYNATAGYASAAPARSAPITINVKSAIVETELTFDNATQTVKYSNTATFTPTVTAEGTVLTKGNITYSENGADIITLGVGETFTYTPADMNVHVITARFNGIDEFNQSSATLTVNVVKADNNIKVEVETASYPDEITVKVTADIAGNFTVDINGTMVNVEVASDGETGLNTTVLTPGIYYANITNYDSDYYDAICENDEFVVGIKDNTIVVSVDSGVKYGESATVHVTATIAGNYTIDINGSTVNVEVKENGESGVNTTEILTKVGNYYANVTTAMPYYNNVAKNTEFTVGKAENNVEIIIAENNYLPGAVIVKVQGGVKGTYVVSFGDGKSVEVEVSQDNGLGEASYALPAGENYQATLTLDNENYETAAVPVTFNVLKSENTVNVTVAENNYLPGAVTVNVAANVADNYIVTIGSESVVVDVKDLVGGVYKGSNTIDLPAGDNYEATTTFADDENYTVTVNPATFNVKKSDIELSIVVPAVLNGNNVSCIITTDVAGTYTISIDGFNPFTKDLIVGENSFTVDYKPALTSQPYNVSVSIDETPDYNAKSANTTFRVVQDEVTFTVAPEKAIYTYGEEVKLIVTISDGATGKVTFIYANGTCAGEIEEISQTKELNLGNQLDVNSYDITAIYEGNTQFAGKTAENIEFNVTPATNEITVEVIPSSYPNNVTIKVTATVDGIYVVDINGTKLNVTSGSNGITHQFNAGTYYANIIYQNANYDIITNNLTSFTVEKGINAIIISVNSYSVVYGSEITVNIEANVNDNYTVVLDETHSIEVPVATEKGNKFSGSIVLPWSLKVSDYELTTAWNDVNYDADITNAKFNVTKASNVVNVTVAENNYLPGAITVNVTADVAGKYTVTVGSESVVVDVKDLVDGEYKGSNTIDLPAGDNYEATTTFADSENYTVTINSATFNVKKSNVELTISTDNSTVYAGETIRFASVVKSGSVDVLVGNVTYKVQNGEDLAVEINVGEPAKFVINTPGEYDIIATYNGNEIYNASTTSAATHVVVKGRLAIDLVFDDGSTEYNTTISNNEWIKFVADTDGFNPELIILVDGVEKGTIASGKTSESIRFTYSDKGNHTVQLKYAATELYDETFSNEIALNIFERVSVTPRITATPDNVMNGTVVNITVGASNNAPGYVEVYSDYDLENLIATVAIGDSFEYLASIDSFTASSQSVTLYAKYVNMKADYVDYRHSTRSSATFNVIRENSMNLTADNYDVRVGDELTLTVDIKDWKASGSNSNIIINVDGEDKYEFATSGYYSPYDLVNACALTFDNAGEHTVYAYYKGYNATPGYASAAPARSAPITINVKPAIVETELTFDNATQTIKYNNTATFTPTVIAEGVNLTKGNITYSENGADIITLGVGESFTYAPADMNVHVITARFNGIDEFNQSSATITVNVIKADNNIKVEVESGNYLDNVTVKVTADIADTYTVKLSNGQEISIEVLENKGTGSKSIRLDAGNYDANVSYVNDCYEGIITDASFNVAKAINNIEVLVENVVLPANATVIVKADVEGVYNVTIGSYSVNVIVGQSKEGSAIIALPAANNYIATTSFVDENYDANIKDAVFNVTKGINNIQVNVNSVTYPDVVMISVSADIMGTYRVDINGTVLDVEANANGLTYKFAAGTYLATVIDYESDIYEANIAPATFTVSKGINNIEVIVDSVVLPGDVAVVVKADVSGSYNVTIGDYSVNVIVGESKEGSASIALPAGNDYVATTSFEDNENYTVTVKEAKFNVTKTNIIVEDVVEVINSTEPTFTIDLPEDATGNLTVKVGDKVYTEEIVNGSATIVIDDLTAGNYSASVSYSGDGSYSNAEADVDFTVEKTDIVLDDVLTVVNSSKPTFTVDLPEGATGNLTVKVGDKVYTEELVNGSATIVIDDLTAGNYSAAVSYSGDGNYSEADANVNFTVEKTDIVLDDVLTVVNSSKPTFTVDLPEGATGNLTVKVGDKVYTEELVNGSATIVIDDLDAGTYAASVSYSGDGNYTDDETDVDFTVEKTAVPLDDVVTVTNASDPTFTLDLPENASGYLLVEVGDKQYWAEVKNGSANIEVSGLSEGNYTARIVYVGDKNYLSASTTKNIDVKSNIPDDAFNITQAAKSDEKTTFSISLPDNATGHLDVDVDGKKYAALLVNGTATITAPELPAGTHNVTVSYTGDDNYSPAMKEATLNITDPVFKITNNKNISPRYSAKASYKVLITRDGKAVAAGEKVTINFNGKTYTVKTNGKGYATFKPSTKLKPKKYTVTATYKGAKVTNKITVKNIIKAKNKKVKKSKKVTKVKVSLMKVNGKYLKSKVLKIKFNKKTYKVKTNKKGVATWKVKKSMLKKLKVGKKYKYKVTYGKDVVTKKLTIKK